MRFLPIIIYTALLFSSLNCYAKEATPPKAEKAQATKDDDEKNKLKKILNFLKRKNEDKKTETIDPSQSGGERLEKARKRRAEGLPINDSEMEKLLDQTTSYENYVNTETVKSEKETFITHNTSPTKLLEILSDDTLKSVRFKGRITDGQTGEQIHCLVKITDPLKMIVNSDLGNIGFWCDGSFDVQTFPGGIEIEISRGVTYSSISKRIILPPNKDTEKNFKLNAWTTTQEQGWYSLDAGLQLVRGKELYREASISLLATAARAYGIDAIAVCAPPRISKSDWTKECLKATAASGVVIMPSTNKFHHPAWGALTLIGTPDIELPSAPALNSLKPLHNYTTSFREQGGIVAYTQVEGRGKCEADDIIAAHPEWKKFYNNEGVVHNELAAELPFDTVVGPLYDAINVTSLDDEAIKIWHTLLSMRYTIALIHSSTIAWGFTENAVPKARTFIHIKKALTPENILKALKAGNSFITNGPLALLTIDDAVPGNSLKADGTKKKIKIWVVCPKENGDITKVELWRGNKVLQTYRGEKTQRFLESFLEISDSESTYYRLYVEATHSSTNKITKAWTNPIYLNSIQYAKPKAIEPFVTGKVFDAKTNTPLEGYALITQSDKPIRKVSIIDGFFSARIKATQELIVFVEGYNPQKKSVFNNSEIQALLRKLHIGSGGRGVSALVNKGVYSHFSELSTKPTLEFPLEIISPSVK